MNMPAPLRLLYQLRENGGSYSCIQKLIMDSRVDYVWGVELIKDLEERGVIKLEAANNTKPRRVSLLESDPDKWLMAIYENSNVA